MASRKPLTIADGAIEQLPATDGLEVGNWSLPASGGNVGDVLEMTSGNATQWAERIYTRQLTSSQTVYVSTTGSDTTGDGSAGSPWATVQHAVTEVGKWFMGNFSAIVQVAAGHYTLSAGITNNSFQGASIHVRGEYEDLTGVSVSSIGASATYDSTVQLQWYDVTLTLPVGKSVVVGDFIMLRAVSGGTANTYLLGTHEVVAWDSGTRVATIRVWQKQGAALPSGAVTCDISLLKTVLIGTGVGISNDRGCNQGTWDQLVLKGPSNASGYGVFLKNTARIICGSRFAVSGWKYGIYAYNSATVEMTYSHASKNIYGIWLQMGGSLYGQTCVVSGTKEAAVTAYEHTMANVGGVKCIACGSPAVQVVYGSTAIANSGIVYDGSSIAYASYFLSLLVAHNVTITSTPTNKTPTSNPGNNGSYIISNVL